MCDTLCALPIWTNAASLFAKNSDRSPNEPHIVIYEPARIYAPEAVLRCTYIDIPQASATHAALLCKPSWTWGAEMGVNGRSVAIGNEAVFTKSRANRRPALTGMDLVRLALERADSAADAIDILIDLLERYGQGGNCGYDHDFFYDNSFLACDPVEAYILETSGRDWVVLQVEGADAISNRLKIDREYDRAGADLAPRIADTDYHWDQRESDPLRTRLSGSGERQGQSEAALTDMFRLASPQTMMRALRQHAPHARPFERGSVQSVCMHFGGLVGDHTTGSLVAELRQGAPATVWCTAASTPCLSAYKPLFVHDEMGLPAFEENQTDRAVAYWRQREAIHRAILAGTIDPGAFRAERDALEAVWQDQERELMRRGRPMADLLALTQTAAQQEQAWIDGYAQQLEEIPPVPGGSGFARRWNRKNRRMHEERG